MSVLLRTCCCIAGVACLVLAASATASAQAVDIFHPAANNYIYAVALQPDGKMLVGGDFTSFGCDPNCGAGSTARNRLARFNVDGTIDATFDPGVNGPVYAIAVQPDGRIIVGGNFSGIGGGTGATARKYLARLNTDGTVDLAFNPGVNMNNYVLALALQPDGKIVVGGFFYAGLGGALRYYLGRLNPDGTADAGFAPGADAAVYSLALQPDGKILVGGLFGNIGGEFGDTPRSRIARLNSDGSVDGGFNPGANQRVDTIAVQADGKILVGGNFTGLGGGTGTTPRSKIGRLESNGLVDAGFDPGANGVVYTLAVQGDGRILAGGAFTMLGGGGAGTSVRNFVGRLNADGSPDGSFSPGAQADVHALAIQPDGKVIAAGTFTGLGGGTGSTIRRYLGRIQNTGPTTQSITVTGGGSIVTWLRGGPAPEVTRVEFATSTDGVNYVLLGAGVRVAGGWQLTGLNLPVDPNRTIRARGFYATGANGASASIAESIVPMSDVNIVENGTFSTGTTNWLFYATPDLSYLVSNVTNGVLQYYRVPPPPGTSNSAVAFQTTGVAIMADAAIRAQFNLGNSSSVRKRISVLILDGNFSDLSVCTFWLPANMPLTTYQMNTHTTKTWTNAAIYFYAASAGSDGGFYQVDNVSMVYSPAGSIARTDCVDPTAPAPPGGVDGPDLLVNGDFSTGTLPPWGTFGQITSQIAGGVFEFYRPAGTPAGVILQPTGQAMAAGDIVTSTFQLGNSSAVRKRVTVILHDNNFTDLTACTFWLAPGQPLSNYWIRSFATKAQANFTVSVYPATVGVHQWIRLDNVTARRTPGSGTLGTECVEPAGGPPTPLVDPPLSGAVAVNAPVRARSAARWIGNGFDAAPGLSGGTGPGFAAGTTGGRRRTLRLADPIDLRSASSATLTLQSWLTSADASAEVQISLDGLHWITVGAIPSSEAWHPLAIDLNGYLGEIVVVQFVLDVESRPSPLMWLVDDLQVHITNR